MADKFFLTSSEFSIHAIKKLKITDTYSWHRTIYGMFSKNRDDRNSSSGILWTLTKSKDPLNQSVYILSDRPVLSEADEVIRYKTISIPDRLFEFEHYSFSVVVNPVKRSNGKVVPVKGRENIINWFSGIYIMTLTIIKRHYNIIIRVFILISCLSESH